MSEHRKTITTISWHPFDNDLILSASVDPRICVWNVRKQKLVTCFTNLKGAIPATVRWHPTEKSTFGFICGRGPLQLVDIEESDGTSRPVEATLFLSDVSHFSWNYQHRGKLAFGHVDGSVSILWTKQKIDRHSLKPDCESGLTEDDPVISLQWDNLSTDYLLVTNLNYGIRLIDTENMFVIMKFQSPSAASRTNSVVWVPSGPGMFVSGGEIVRLNCQHAWYYGYPSWEIRVWTFVLDLYLKRQCHAILSNSYTITNIKTLYRNTDGHD